MTDPITTPDSDNNAGSDDPGMTPDIDPVELKKIDVLMAEIETLKAENTEMKREYQVGGFDRAELEELRVFEHQILELKRTILDHLAAVRARARGENVISPDEVNSTQPLDSTDPDAPRVIDTGADVTQDDYGIEAFDSDTFRNAFVSSYRRWTGDAQTALNSASVDMINIEADDVEFAVGDFWEAISQVAKLDPRTAAMFGIINKVRGNQGLVMKFANTSQSSIPPVIELRNKLKNGFRDMCNEDISKLFDDFIKAWKATNAYPDSVNDVYETEFLPACRDYQMICPSQKMIERKFLGIVVAASKDTDAIDWDEDDTFGKDVTKEHGKLDGGEFPDAGYVDISFVDKWEHTARRSPVRRWKELKVELNDVERQIIQAVKSQWKGEPICNLPFPIRFRINKPVTSGTTPLSDVWNGDFIAIRNSRTPGNLTTTITRDWGQDDKQLNDDALERFETALKEVLVDQL